MLIMYLIAHYFPQALPDWLDWEVIIAFATAGAGVWYMISESRQYRRDADERIALASRLATVETAIASQAPHTISERVSELEGKAEHFGSVSDLSAKLSGIEVHIEYMRESIGKLQVAGDGDGE